ncbi:MAG: hypothetical protein HZB33_14925 [Nitrospirae bacterium]|nr:hypothetical protein [Nitrospirota bacterium]
MKKMIFVTVVIFLLANGLSGVPAFGMDHSQPEHCKSKANMASQAQKGHDHGGHDGAGEKLQWAGMSVHMIPMMKTLSGMTQMLADAMGTGMDDKKMDKLAGLTDEVSTHMVRMYDIMNNKAATEAELHMLHMGINETEARIKLIK